jgi:hypothetical protein
MVRDSNPGRGKRFFSSPKLPDPLWGPFILLSKVIGGKAAMA